ncbi:hypothetical protein PENSPDRAFT_654306 [Peniophora sp. CONT]|nr:hypothetical protein PENSPDRAFT_654306 [Peniophora sp. CONT]
MWSIVGGVAGGLAALAASIFGVLCWRRRKRGTVIALHEEDKLPLSLIVDPYSATVDHYPVIERRVAFERPEGGRGYLTKRQHTTHNIPSSSGSSAEPGMHSEVRNADSSTSVHPLVEVAQRRDERLVRVDASALQRLLWSMNGMLSDLQRGGIRQGGEGSIVMTELPPYNEEAPGRR